MKVFRLISNRFLRKDDGAVLVEFAIVFPVMLLMFAAIVESGRMFWSYQQVVSGVRDASRFFGRAAPFTICTDSLVGWRNTLAGIVENAYQVTGDNSPAATVFGGGVTLDATTPVTITLTCIEDDGAGGNSSADLYAADTVVIATVTANMEITLPFFPILNIFAGGGLPPTVEFPVSDQVRIYGQ